MYSKQLRPSLRSVRELGWVPTPCGCSRSSVSWTRFSRKSTRANSAQKGLGTTPDLPTTNLSTRCVHLCFATTTSGSHARQYSVSPEDASITLHRAAFLDALVRVVDPRATHFNKRCVGLAAAPANPRRVTVRFADGSTHEADVVLGADGIRSSVRDFVVGGVGRRAAFSNTVAYRGLIPRAALTAAGFKTDVAVSPACFVGPDKHIVVVPLKKGELINVAAFAARYDVPIGSQTVPERTWVEQVARDELSSEYDGWGPDVAALIRCMPDTLSRWAVHVVHPPLDTYAAGRVALLGDAAHGMLPHLGAGAGQGLEDAYVLARLLSHPDATLDNVEAVLKVYSDVRRPRAQSVWDASYRAGSAYHFRGAHGPSKEGLSEDMRDMWKPVWHYDLDSDVESALLALRESGAFPTTAGQ